MGPANKENISSTSVPVTPAKPAKSNQSKLPKKAKWSSADDNALLSVLKAQQAAGNQADNNWKKVVWVAAEQALAGSEKLSGGAAKKAKSCNDRWGTVCDIVCTFRVLILLAAQGELPGCPKASESLWLGLG
jgi:hypothetical protein